MPVGYRYPVNKWCYIAMIQQLDGWSLERLYKTLLDVHFRIRGGEWYESVEEVQKGLATYLHTYNPTGRHSAQRV